MKVLTLAAIVLSWPAVAQSQLFEKRDAEWCPDLAPMSIYLSIGFELKVVSERVYAPRDSNNAASMPNGVRSETVFFLQKGPQLEQCTEQTKWDFLTVATCSHLVERFDSSTGSPCN